MKTNKMMMIAGISLISLAMPMVSHASSTTDATISYTDGGISFDPLHPESGEAQIPRTIDFGTMQIQTAKAEKLTAKTGDVVTTGAVAVSDNRATASGWHVKINQQNQFQTSNNQALENAALFIRTAEITNNLGNVLSNENLENQNHQLHLAQDRIILEAAANEGLGETTLAISGFDLEIPAHTEKSAAQYSTTLNWIFSDSPGDVE